LRAIIAEQLNNPADPRKAMEGILADLIQFSEKYAGTDEGTAALFNHGMLALNIGEVDVAERSLRKAASLAKDPRLTAEIETQLKQFAIRPGKLPPDFTAPTLAGGNVSPKDFRGRVLLLDFWATWCGHAHAAGDDPLPSGTARVGEWAVSNHPVDETEAVVVSIAPPQLEPAPAVHPKQ
jgi:hypothetical protein